MATHEKCKSNYDDWKASVHCSLKNVFSSTTAYLVGENIRKILGISHFRPDEMARLVPSPYDFTCKREDANNIRDQLVSVTTDSHRHIWFSMQTNPFHYIYKTHSMINEDPVPPTKEYPVYCYFGSMYSYSTFKIHSEEHPVRHDLRVLKWHEEPEAIRITTTDKSKEISIPIRWIQKPILVNLKDRPCVVLMLKYSVKMKKRIKMKGREKYERVCKSDDNRFMTVVSKSSDILLSFSEISHTYAFIEELTRETDEYHDKFTVNFVTLEQNVVKKENQLFYLPSSASHNQHYALNMLFSMGYVFHDKYSQQLHDEFVKFDKDSFNDMCYYLKEKLELNHCYRIKGIFAEFGAYLKEKRKDEKDLEEPKLPYCVGCISITPLRILYQKMQLTIGNRALRLKTFGGPDMFLLVHIREEDNGKLKDYDRTIKYRLRSKMFEGIQVVGKIYRLFGTSTSQFKEMSFWFLANGNRSIEDAWKELGDFSDIKNVASYIARIGLYFSTSKETKISFTYVDEKKFALNEKFSATKIPDIKTADDKYCFTDGIGTMSLGIAGLIALNLDIPLYTREDIPSAYQVRIAGCKGMLAIYPDSKLDEYYIKVRDSMQKFKSNDWSLEICEHSKPMELKFNNQVIMLLSDLGNLHDVFESYQNAAIINLPRQSEHEQWRKLKYSSAKEDLLKNKIPLPLNEGRNMFGVVDETGILEYGQVFIQYKDLDSTNENRYIVLTGEVLVAKMPCLHPGDFRRLTAVNVPKLQTCIRDCIVFPQKGSRPHPNEMSGSDLDGDQYWVYWGRRLKIRQMDDPLSYEAASPKKVPTITQDIIVDHIIDSLGAASQGIICDTHLAIADFHREHTRFKECIYLAELFARAVDAPKSGETINLDRVYELRDEYCERYPLFMKKYDRLVQNSDSTLNKLFMKARHHFFSQRDSGISLQSSSSVMLKPLKQQQQQHQSKVDSTDREFQQWLVSHSTRIPDDKNSSTTPKPRTTTELTQNSESTSAASGKTKKKTELVEVSSSKEPRASMDSQSAELLPTASDKPIKKPRAKKESEEGRRNSIDSQTSEICLDQAAGSAPAQKTKLASSTKTNQASKVDPSTLGAVSLNFQSTEEKTATTKTKKPQETSDAFGTPIKLINSAASSTNSEVSSNLSSLSDKPTNRNLIFNGMKTTTNRLKWNSSKNDYFIVDLDNKDSHENNSTEKVVSSILGFGKTSSFPPESQLTLVISWGQLFLKISPAVGDTKPKNIKELNLLINEMDRVEYIFEECDVKEITKERDPSEKSRTEYVLVCNCRDISSNDISLIFDEKKKLKRFIYDSTPWICAVRRGEPYQDSFYKINHTTMEIDSKNELFSSYINSIFKNSNEIELLTGISPKLTIVYKLLKPTVQIISLKRMVRFAFEQLEQRKLLSHQFNTLKNLEYSFYQVTYISTEKVDGKIQERKTLEFHATQFQIAKKHEQDLEQLVKLAETFFD